MYKPVLYIKNNIPSNLKELQWMKKLEIIIQLRADNSIEKATSQKSVI